MGSKQLANGKAIAARFGFVCAAALAMTTAAADGCCGVTTDGLGGGTKGDIRAVFFGDSITEAWPREMPEYFAAEHYIARGVGGETTSRMLSRFERDVIDLAPRVVVILAGTNDIAENDGPYAAAATQARLRAMAERAESRGIRVVLASLLPALDYPWRRGLEPAAKISALNAWIKVYAARSGYTYVDYHGALASPAGGLPTDFSEDGVHPNRSGYRIMATLAKTAVEAALTAEAGRGKGDFDIVFSGRTPEGLVGNGQSVVQVTPFDYRFFHGGDGEGQLRLIVDGKARPFDAARAEARFFPGGVVYRQAMDDLSIEMLHGAGAKIPYFVAVRVSGASGRNVEFEAGGRGAPTLLPRGRQRIELREGRGELVLAAGAPAPALSWQSLRETIEAPYRRGLALSTPDAALDRMVAFSRFLLDLGFDGRLHVCELFRWRDVWSRDLGSGLAPGALASGRFAAARTTIEYDLHRYATHNPTGLRVTEDPSQGGSAEGTAWLTRAVWRDYLQSGERQFLAEAARTLRPWVEAWIARDADERGLLVDTTEWMDHSRFFLFPDGARVLYSNALMADLMRTFGHIEDELGNHAAAQRLLGIRARFVAGINSELWDERLGAYDNLSLWGKRDERLSSDGNVLAVLAGAATPERAQRTLATVRREGWRAAGSVTIVPPMSHVDPGNDHNYKVWPWWNAVEARARFRNGDVDGGLHLLDRIAATLEDEHAPGLVEELTTPEGISEGGHAFLTAAGATLDAVWEGLLGIDILEPGAARLRIAPNVPASWSRWRAEVPLAQGQIEIFGDGKQLQIVVGDPRVKVVEAPENASVEGAQRAALSASAQHQAVTPSAPRPLAPPPSKKRRAAVFFEEGLSGGSYTGLPTARIPADALAQLDAKKTAALIVVGNALPLKSRSGADVQAALARYLDQGGALVFFGATMAERSGMGEHGGVVDWHLPGDGGSWRPIDPHTGQIVERPERLGVVSWGPGGDFFNSWETSRGAFGFSVDGRGVEFVGPLRELPAVSGEMHEAFTDFAVSQPWLFQPLAFTQTRKRILFPDQSERYPCAARLVNTRSGGELILIPASLARRDVGLVMLERLNIDLR